MSSFARWRERFVVLAADDWFIWVEDRRTGLVWSYNTELWEEWLDLTDADGAVRLAYFMGEANPPDGPAVALLIPFAWRYSPVPWPAWDDENDRELGRQETRAEWDARRGAEAERMLEWALARAYADPLPNGPGAPV